jgi:hypothetical protein
MGPLRGVAAGLVIGAALFAAGLGAPTRAESPPSAACRSWNGPPVQSRSLLTCFYEASRRASAAVGRQVAFETQDRASDATAAAFANAATVASDALVNLAAEPGGASALAGLTEVRIAAGAEPSATRADQVITVVIVPSRSSAGLPTIAQIERAATGR